MLRPHMKSIWDEVFPSRYNYCDNDIKDVSYPAEDGGVLGIMLEVNFYDESGLKVETIYRKITATGAYVFDYPQKNGIVGQALKQIFIYPDIIRIDIVTTGALLRFECDNYRIKDIRNQKVAK